MFNTYAIPVSVKGIVIEDKKVWLRKNERNEWELPGGKLDKGEQPETTIKRELKEELGFEIEVTKIIQANHYKIEPSIDEEKGVLILSYLCKLIRKTNRFEIIGEAGKAKFKQFAKEDIKNLNMPQLYKDAIFAGIDL